MTSLKRACGLLLALALVLGLQAVAYAQTGAASITGLVTDQSGAAAPGVTVTATNQATNVEYTAVSNQAGNYTITSVPVGTYVVKSALSGFKTTTTRPITLEAKQIARLDLKMEVGALEDTVEVTAQAPVLQTESATVGEVHLGQHGRVAAAERPQLQPAGAAHAGRRHAQPGGVHDIGAVNSARPLRQRQPGADEQLPGRRHRHERDGRQPGRLSAQPRRPRRDQRGDEQLRGRHRERGRSRDQQRHQVRREPVPRQRVRVLPQQRPRREHLGQQPLRREEGRAHAAHLRRHASAARSSRTSCSSSSTTRAPCRDQPGPDDGARWPRPRGAPGTSRASCRDGHRTPSPALPFPNNQIPLSRISPTALAILNDPRLPAPEP